MLRMLALFLLFIVVLRIIVYVINAAMGILVWPAAIGLILLALWYFTHSDEN